MNPGEEYYLDLDGNTAGPFSLEQVQKLLEAGTITEDTIYCHARGLEWLPVKLLAPLFATAAVAPPEPVSQAPALPYAERSEWVCTQCNWIGRPATHTPGSGLIEIVLWLFACLPGLIYSIWRHTSARGCCGSCGAFELFPVDSPRGRTVASIVPEGPSWSDKAMQWLEVKTGKLWAQLRRRG